MLLIIDLHAEFFILDYNWSIIKLILMTDSRFFILDFTKDALSAHTFALMFSTMYISNHLYKNV